MSEQLHGVMAEFDSPDTVVAAARRAYAEGYRKMDAYSPFPIEELWEAIGFHHTGLGWLVLGGGIAGCLGGFGMQYYLSVINYPLNIGGRPLNSWPSFVPISFEVTILLAALSAVLGMLALNGFPRPHHPVFNVPAFARASQNRFFLCIEARDPKFEPSRTRAFLQGLEPIGVTDVEN